MPTHTSQQRARGSRLLDFVTVLSLMACVAAGVLWVRSHRRWESVHWHHWAAASRTFREHCLLTSKGVVYYARAWQAHDTEAAARLDAPLGYTTGADVTRWWRSSAKNAWERPPMPDVRRLPSRFEWAGFAFWRQGHTAPVWDESGTMVGTVKDTRHTVGCPIWLVAMLLALLPAVRLMTRAVSLTRARRRSGGGACVACGYDLRATPERCPECGNMRRPVEGA